MVKFQLSYGSEATTPEVTLTIPMEDVKGAHLSVANRCARNRTCLYQQKHLGASFYTRERGHALGAMNWPIAEHYRLLQELHPELGFQRQEGAEQDRIEYYPPVVAFSISDLTANPLRPHYIAVPTDGLEPLYPFRAEEARSAVYRRVPDPRFFFLEDEPIDAVPYSLLIAERQEGSVSFAIRHGMHVMKREGSALEASDLGLQGQLKWWAACPPVVKDGAFDAESYATLDYDLRHLFGFPRDDDEKRALRELQQLFPDWEGWCAAIKKRLGQSLQHPKGYHAVLGIRNGELVIIHRFATIPAISEELQGMGVEQAVLLDSGGSCALWANWLNSGTGGLLAHAWNFRPSRGALVFLVLEGRCVRHVGWAGSAT